MSKSVNERIKKTYPYLKKNTTPLHGTFDVISSDFKREVTLTEQNLHPLVQVSPINIIVAVAVPFSPPQHSPMLGHLKVKQTINLIDENEKRNKNELRGWSS